MKRNKQVRRLVMPLAVGLLGLVGCRTSMPHAFTWPAGGDTQQTHPKPPEGGYYANWDPYAVELEVTPLEAVNPVRTQHVLVATVKDKDGKPLPNRRVEWILARGDNAVGEIVEVDESGWRASRGYKVDNLYAVSHTNNCDHVLDRGNDDPSDDVHLTKGQTFCVITSPMEGDTFVTAYAPGIYDWSKHKVFVAKHWYDISWQFPPPATNPIGTTHTFVTTVTKHSDGTFIPNHAVTYKIMDGPPATLEPGGGQAATVLTDAQGQAKITIKQTTPAEGTNRISMEIVRPENVQCCEPAVNIATGFTSKTWIGPKISCEKTAPPQVLHGQQFEYRVTVNNPSQVDCTDVNVTDTLPDGIAYVSSTPSANASGQSLTWSLGSIPKGSNKVITIQAKGTRSGRFENCAEVRAAYNLSTRCCASTTVVSPKLLVEKRCPAEVMLCEPIEYVLTVRNSGDGPAVGVKLSDNLPAGLTTTDGKTSVASNVGDLKPGEAKEVRFTVKASKTGKYDNKVTASADGGLSAEATCSTVVKQTVLAVKKTCPDVRFIGRPAPYEITVSNTGDAPARDTTLTDPIPAGTEFVSASDGGTFSGGTVTWKLGTIEPGGSKKVSLNLKAVTRGIAKNTARATAVCAEASVECQTEIKGVPAILLEVIDLADPIEIGANETYEISVTNQGSAEDINIVIEATLPDQMDYVSSTGPTQAAVQGKVVRFAPVASLAPKAKLTYRVVVKGNKEGDVRMKVVLDSDMIDPPVQETESTHIY